MEKAKPAIISVTEQFESEIERMREDIHPQNLVDALKLLVRLFENIANNPQEVKYHTINKKNKTLQEKLFKITAIEKLLILAGF